LLASALAGEGQVDEACARAREAVDLAAGLRSARAVQRVAAVRVELAPYDDERAVIELDDYIRAVLPEAAT
jgi:hypothetical protein